ncbi:hypothetical protein NERG_00053 [Nematocida ausubeli]|uniref:Uncharacterized protein n=2 Tax=Nematocida ausubeli (strain ATCC PRA-371 / ERTm2) TaxID=1913371 RepID=H8Z8Y2_NEMA1|nr:hypothetical protein NERG_00053 [Nematocida ausubeli]
MATSAYFFLFRASHCLYLFGLNRKFCSSMNISNNLRQLKFMKMPVKEEEEIKKRETLGTWLLKEITKTKTFKKPHTF